MMRHAVRRLPVHLGESGWSAILGSGPVAQPLHGDRNADFVVIGAGFAGLSAARRLTQLQPGSRIAVLDAGRLAEGAAGRNAGFMIDLPHELTADDYVGSGDDRAMIDRNRHAIAFARAAAEEYGINPGYLDPAGKVNAAASAAAHAHNESYARHLARLGENSEMLDAQQMRALTGSPHYVSGLYTPGTLLLQPAGYIRGLGAGLRGAGVDIHENSPVVGVEREGDAWRVVTDAGAVSTPRVILTVNGHLESFGFASGRLMHVFLYAAMTPELDSNALDRLRGQPRWGITPADPMGTSVRRIDTSQGGNRIVVRTCATLCPSTRPSGRELERARQVMQRKFDQRFPQLAGLTMQHAWAGHLCLSRNGVAVMREVEQGIYSGCVQNGLGLTRGTLTGIGAAELACGQTSAITEHFTAEEAPRRLPPQPFQQIGANTLLRWREWRARAE